MFVNLLNQEFEVLGCLYLSARHFFYLAEQAVECLVLICHNACKDSVFIIFIKK